MVGCQKYTDEQVRFILSLHIKRIPHTKIRDRFAERYNQPKYNVKKVRYVIENFGKDPKYGNLLLNMDKPRPADSNSNTPSSATTPMITDYGGPNAGPETPRDELARATQEQWEGKTIPCTTCNGTGHINPPPPGIHHDQTDCISALTAGTPQTSELGFSPGFSNSRASSLLNNCRPTSSATNSIGNIGSSSLSNSLPLTGDITDNSYGGNFMGSPYCPPVSAESYQTTAAYGTMAQTSCSGPTMANDPPTIANNFNLGDYRIPKRSDHPEATPMRHWLQVPPLKRRYEESQPPPVPLNKNNYVPTTTSGSTHQPFQPIDYNTQQGFNFPFLAGGSRNVNTVSSTGSTATQCGLAPELPTKTTTTGAVPFKPRAAKKAKYSTLGHRPATPFFSQTSLLGVPTMVAGAAAAAAAAAGWVPIASLPSLPHNSALIPTTLTPPKVESGEEGGGEGGGEGADRAETSAIRGGGDFVFLDR